MKCDMAVQTEVALQNIRYLSDLGLHMKAAWVGFEKIRFVLFRCGKRSYLGHFSLQCERSLSQSLFQFQLCVLSMQALRCYIWHLSSFEPLTRFLYPFICCTVLLFIFILLSPTTLVRWKHSIRANTHIMWTQCLLTGTTGPFKRQDRKTGP